MKYIISFIFLTLLVNQVTCVLGIDLASPYTESVFTCLKGQGFTFASVRAYHSYGAVDTNAVAGLNNARKAGMSTDIYMFPCRGKNATAQANQVIAAIPKDLYSLIWIDVETNPSSGCSWSGHDSTSNCEFLNEIIRAIKAQGRIPGVYASTYMWQTIFGSKAACPSAATVPLWYAHYDSNPSFSDFSPFGGWTKPTIKQFNGDVTVCGADVDKNFKP